MRTQSQRDHVSVHRPLAVGAVAFMLVMVLTGASLAHLGQVKLGDTVLRASEALAGGELREDAQREAHRRAAHASEIVAQAPTAARVLAAEVARLGPAAVDSAPSPLPFDALTSQRLAGFNSKDHGIFGLSPSSVAEDAPAGDTHRDALVWRGLALSSAMRTAAAQVRGGARVLVWVRGEGVVVHPEPPADAVARWLAPHAGFGAELLAPHGAEDAGWLPPRVGPDGRATLAYVEPVRAADGKVFALVRAEVDLEGLVASLARADDGDVAHLPVVLDADAHMLAAAPGLASAFPTLDESGSKSAAIEARLRELLGSDGFLLPAKEGLLREGRDVLLAIAPIEGIDWSMGVVTPRHAVAAAAVPASEETSRVVRDFALTVFGFAGIFGVLAAVSGLGFADTLRRRLARLVDAAREHAEGHLSTRAPIDGGDEIGAIGLALNATALRMQDSVRRLDESRRRLSGLIESMAEGLVITDAEDRVTFANARFVEIVRRPGPTLIGHYLEEFLVPQSLDEHRTELQRRREGASTRCEVTWRTNTPPHPRTLVSAMPLFDSDGRYTGTCGIVTDITSRARAQEESARAEKLRALGEMAGGVAHDFNNVLTAVLGNTQYLMQEDLDENVRETLRIIETAAMDGTETVNRIRKFTKPSQGMLGAGPVDTAAATHEVLRMARPRIEKHARERGLRYEVVLRRDAHRDARGNPSEVREVLLNLVNNAFEAMPEGGTLTVETFDRGEDSVGLRVSDTGRGIPEEHLNKIFDPFFSTKRGGRCSGLGLSICFGIVRAHGGRIDVKSEPGIGTTFTVVLPSFQETPLAEDPDPLGPPPDPRVLLVSPRRRQASALQKALNGRGVHVAYVDTALVASDLISDRGIFNTLLVEHDLGAQNGWELARSARRLRPDLRIVLMTDTDRGIDETQARNAGIDRTLVRPFDDEDAYGMIRSALAEPPAHVPSDKDAERDGDGQRPRAPQHAPLLELWGAPPPAPTDAAPGAQAGAGGGDADDEARMEETGAITAEI